MCIATRSPGIHNRIQHNTAFYYYGIHLRANGLWKGINCNLAECKSQPTSLLTHSLTHFANMPMPRHCKEENTERQHSQPQVGRVHCNAERKKRAWQEARGQTFYCISVAWSYLPRVPLVDILLSVPTIFCSPESHRDSSSLSPRGLQLTGQLNCNRSSDAKWCAHFRKWMTVCEWTSRERERESERVASSI